MKETKGTTLAMAGIPIGSVKRGDCHSSDARHHMAHGKVYEAHPNKWANTQRPFLPTKRFFFAAFGNTFIAYYEQTAA